MARTPSTFRQRDLAAAVKAVRSAGCEVKSVEVGKNGTIAVVTTAGGVEQINDLDRWMAGRARKA